MILAIPGLCFLGISSKLLRAWGSGANAFRLAKQIVEEDICQYTRNPMSLGYYLFSVDHETACFRGIFGHLFIFREVLILAGRGSHFSLNAVNPLRAVGDNSWASFFPEVP
jgi:hypothetical protein